MTRLSPWIVVDDYCATRVLFGTDPAVVANRVAFIEKSPRVRLNETQCAPEGGVLSRSDDPPLFYWLYGPKGSGGPSDSNHEYAGNYGFYKPSREWCDAMLRLLGYELDCEERFDVVICARQTQRVVEVVGTDLPRFEGHFNAEQRAETAAKRINCLGYRVKVVPTGKYKKGDIVS